MSNNLDPSAERSFASVYATVAHELFHLVQFSYFPAEDAAVDPAWILEGTASALETRVTPQLDDLVSTIQLRRWFAATGGASTAQSYGAQLLWRSLDAEQPRFLPALFRGSPRGRRRTRDARAVAATYARIAGRPFAQAFHRFAVAVAADHGDVIEPAFSLRRGATRRAVVAPLAVHYVRPVLPRRRRVLAHRHLPARTRLGLRDPDVRAGERGGGRAAALRRIAGATLGRRPDDDVRGPGALRAEPRLASPLLVVSNGGGRAVRYAVSAR